MATRIDRKPPKPAAPPTIAAAALHVLDRLLALAAAAVVISILYLLAGLLSGAVASFPNTPNGSPLPLAAREHFLHAARTAAYVFMGGMWGITFISVFRFRENDVAGYLGIVGGGLCYFVLPWLVGASLMRHYASANEASDLLLTAFRVTGKVLLLLTAAYFVVKVTLRAAHRPGRVRPAPQILSEGQRKDKAPTAGPRHSLLRKCWELSLCRENLRENCPSYRAGKACWKRGTGCQCDPTLARRLIEDLEARLRGEMPENERLARERMKEQLTYRIAAQHGASYCRECAVYDEHQYYKYRAIYWIAYPITAAIMFLALPALKSGYQWFDAAMAAWLSSLSMLPSADRTAGLYMDTVYNFNAEWIFIVSIALIVAAYLLDTVDYAIFKAKL